MAEFNFWKANASQFLQAGTTLLDFYGQYQSSKIYDAQGDIAETMANIEARSMERKAARTEAAGTRAAMAEQYKGRVAMSDATAAMVAQGGVVNPEQLAKLKQRADYNALSAVYDAKSAAADLRMAAGLKRIEGKFKKSQYAAQGLDVRQAATTTAIGQWPRSWNQNPNPPSTGGYGGYTGGRPGTQYGGNPNA